MAETLPAPFAGIVADFAIACWDACDAHAYRTGKARYWMRRKECYLKAAEAIPEHLADRKRADLCTVAAAWHVLAWTALADAMLAPTLKERRDLIDQAWSARRAAACGWAKIRRGDLT